MHEALLAAEGRKVYSLGLTISWSSLCLLSKNMGIVGRVVQSLIFCCVVLFLFSFQNEYFIKRYMQKYFQMWVGKKPLMLLVLFGTSQPRIVSYTLVQM